MLTLYSAAPQIYFDNYDDYRKGHAISAGCARYLSAHPIGD